MSIREPGMLSIQGCLFQGRDVWPVFNPEGWEWMWLIAWWLLYYLYDRSHQILPRPLRCLMQSIHRTHLYGRDHMNFTKSSDGPCLKLYWTRGVELIISGNFFPNCAELNMPKINCLVSLSKFESALATGLRWTRLPCFWWYCAVLCSCSDPHRYVKTEKTRVQTG